jgi:hypothetical protein
VLAGVAAVVRTAYDRGKAAGRSEVKLESLQEAQAQTGRALEDIRARLAQLEHAAPNSSSRRPRKA